jgi:hypothetical protein
MTASITDAEEEGGKEGCGFQGVCSEQTQQKLLGRLGKSTIGV